ncbi:MAG: ABC-2 family transporter protein [Anaerolineae bacterium]|nr:ABC-2 family transporter protein [Anaerolineae bacterium]MDX9830136.1 ABC-2 family transporter protein [Anaerolineae bacterium]
MIRYGHVLVTSARQQWVYRGEMVARAVQIVLFMAVFMALWSTAYGVSGRTELEGYSLGEMIWYLAMTETMILSSSRIFNEIAEAVRAGDLAYTLARPLRYPLFQVANSLGGTVPRFLLNFVIASAVVLVALRQVEGSLAGMGAFLLLAALALFLDALFAVLIGLAAFWLEEIMPVYWMYNKLVFTIGGLFLPLELFPAGLQQAVRWLPFQLMAYAPARALVKFEPAFVLQTLASQAIYIVILLAVIHLVWRVAQRRLVVHGG